MEKLVAYISKQSKTFYFLALFHLREVWKYESVESGQIVLFHSYLHGKVESARKCEKRSPRLNVVLKQKPT